MVHDDLLLHHDLEVGGQGAVEDAEELFGPGFVFSCGAVSAVHDHLVDDPTREVEVNGASDVSAGGIGGDVARALHLAFDGGARGSEADRSNALTREDRHAWPRR